MTRRWTLAALGFMACNIGVDEGNSGLSAGMSGATSGATASPTSAAAETDAPADSTGGSGMPGETEPSGPSSEGTMGMATTSGGPTTMTSGDSGSTGGAPGDPLDPGLDVPEDGEPCMTPGSLVECPGIAVCRFHTTEQGLCESCDSCGNLGAACVEGTDCDILFACYLGQCTNFCMLGSFECGPPEDCLDIGHPTHGVCAPF